MAINKSQFDKLYEDAVQQDRNIRRSGTAPSNVKKVTQDRFERIYTEAQQGNSSPAVSVKPDIKSVYEQNLPQVTYETPKINTVELPSVVENQGLWYAPDGNKNILGVFGEGVAKGVEGAFSNFANTSDTIKGFTAMPGQVHNQLKNIMYDADKTPMVADIVKDSQQKYGVGTQYYKDIQKGIVSRNQKQAEDMAALYEKYADVPYSEIAINAGQGVGAMLPAMLAGAASGRFMRNGLSDTLTEEAKKNAIQYAADMASKPVFAANVFGSAKAEALANGASENQAESYAMADTALELGIEALFGGIPFLGEGKISVKGLTDKYLKTAAGQFLVNRLADITGEGIEEVASGIIEPFLKRAFYDKDAQNASLKELASAFGNGALVSAILGVANFGGNVDEYRQINDKITKAKVAKNLDFAVTETKNDVKTAKNVRFQKKMLENPTAGISDFGEQGKPFDVSKLPQVRKQQIENPVESINDRGENTGKPFDIKQLPQQQKTAPQAVETENNKQTPVNKNQPVKVNYGLADYVKTLPETAGKNAQLHLNKQYGDSGMTAGQFIESNIDGRFFEENKKYFFEKDGRKTPVRKSMYEYALWLQSSAKDSNVPGKIDIDTNVGAGTDETVAENTTVDTTDYGNAKVIGKKGNIDILDSVPDGWKKFDMQTAPVGYVGVTNNKSLFGGERKSALVSEDVFKKDSYTNTAENTDDIDIENTKVNDNPDTHTPEEMKVIDEFKNAVDADFVDYIQRARTDEYVGNYTVTKTNSRTEQAMRELTGLQKVGSNIVANKNTIQHIDNGHGKFGSSDSTMVNDEDIARMKYVIDNFDNAYLSITDTKATKLKNGYNAPKVIFEKKVDGTYVVVEAVTDANSNNNLIISAFFAKNGIDKTKIKEEWQVSKAESDKSQSADFTAKPLPSASSNLNVTQKNIKSQEVDSLPENKQTKAKKEKSTPENKITDFGEKISGARKDMWKDRGLDVRDIEGMTEKEKAKFITKDNIWKKPNYEALIKDGKDKNVTYFLKTVRDALPTKPEFRTTNADLAKQVQEEYVKQMREITDRVMALETKEQIMNAFDEVLVKGGYITKDSSRLYAPWYPTEKGKYIFTEKLFNAFRNAEGTTGWRYLTDKVRKDQFGVPKDEKIPKGYGLREFENGWGVLKGNRIVQDKFATREAALSWLKENTKKAKNNRFVPPSVERVRREGADVRKGEAATGDSFMEKFGFRGGQFGEWTNQKERQMNLNFAYDAFHDLARTLGISEKDVSFGGKLAIAFGARGRGGAKAAAAHYEYTEEVINLTRMKGAGTLGHEWAHALDDFIGQKVVGSVFTKYRGRQSYEPFNKVMDAMKWREATAEELAQMNENSKNDNIRRATSWLNSVFSKSMVEKMTDSQKTKYENLKESFLNAEKGSVDKLNELHKEITNRVIPKSTRDTLMSFEYIWLQTDTNQRTSAKVPTDYIKNSRWFDKYENRRDAYYSSDEEMFARAFHTYILDKTEGVSDYLNGSAEWHVLPDLENNRVVRAYPTGTERAAINKAFDEFFDALKKDGYLTAQEYDAGEMISYSTDGAKVTMEGKIVIEPKKEKAPESKRKLVPEKFAKDNNVSNKKEKVQGASGKLPESVGAMKADPKKMSHLVNEYGEIKPGENPARFVSVPVSTDGKDRVAKAIRTIMEAGVTKEKMQSRFEKLVADGVFSHDVMHNKETADRAISYIEKYGFAKTYDNWRNKIDNKLLITADDMAQAIMMYTAAADVGEYDITDILAADIAAMTVNSGQVSQVIRILKKTSPQGRLYYTQKSLEAIQDDINDKYGDKAITIEVPQEMKDAIKNAQTSEELQKATEAMHLHIAKQLPFSWSNFINSWRYLAMLGNTRTQVRNVLSNVMGIVAQEYTNFVQTGVETGVNAYRKAKGKEEIEKTSTVRKPTKQQLELAAKDYRTVRESLSGKGKYKNDSLSALQSLKNPFEITGTWGKNGDEYVGLKGIARATGDVVMKGLTAWNTATNWAMDKGDQIFSEKAYKRFFARYLAANNINPDKITDSQLFKARNWATKQALESVYRENNEIANALSRLEKKWSKSDNLVAKAGGVALGGLMPFKSTPMNITKRAFEYTPAGIAIEAAQQMYDNHKHGVGYNIPAIIDKASKSLSGSSLILLGAYLAKIGLLTGGLGDDKEDKMKKQMGQQSYAINVGDYSYTMEWAGAGMMPLFVGADIYSSNSENEDWLMNIGNALANAGSPIIETSMMTGFMDAIQTMSYEDVATEKLAAGLSSAMANYLGQFVPTLFGQVARAVDDTSRSSYTDVKGVLKPLAKTAQKAQNKIPFLSKTNVPYMDVWGNEEKNFGGNVVGRMAYNMLSPGYVSTKSNDKVEKMLADLYDKTGETSVLPSNYTTYKRVGNTTFRFTDKQFENYTKTYGQAAYDILEDLSGDKGFKSMKDAYKAEVIEKAYRYSTAIASNEVVDKALEVRQKNQKKALEKGVSAYYVFGGLIEADGMGSEGNANGSLSKTEVVAYIESRGGLSKTEKAYLFAALGNSNWKNPYA